MILLTILLFLGLFIVACVELANYAVLGKLLLDENKLTRVIDKALTKNKELNQYNSTMIYLGNLPYISSSPGLLSKYYISDIGRIPRWSKTTRLINKAFKDLEQTKTKKVTRKDLDYYL
jgi:hypothetical protein